jgi:hypothetical protein
MDRSEQRCEGIVFMSGKLGAERLGVVLHWHVLDDAQTSSGALASRERCAARLGLGAFL